MSIEENSEKKKGVLLRFTPKLFAQLLKIASEESLKRGYQVSVPALCLEVVLAWLEARKKK